MGFRLSFAAEEDILGIAEEGLRLFGTVQAKRYHDELFAIFDLIAANPRMARERHEISPPVRIHPFKAHLVVYRVEDNGDILIIRIRHGHEDWAGDRSDIKSQED
ncbi:plasmid stabilization protein ParE [Labrys sp. WJW]|uniref:type II toxin-antitoxin system RelE/ParE family toxin n=1 Tax=Labrys sp. WJW TaxID=1737983 RepID=UPI00082E4E4B|nr:type II toxin-antitoxin system RelE/ParE family toxin [Labrys sp. WJW]OCC02290.1 plasmid stabilization protein ParE [Labrys sp. WJW]